ncbi:MAG: hypothetical protein L0H41_03315 [Microlunatus sp.]|nr:hypothetical protein [Microlunatus sp.]MDN5769827.1 hypothetical protein [Microlunatus sp.]
MRVLDYKLRPDDQSELLMPVDGRFNPDELRDCPEPVQRYLLHSIQPGTKRYQSIRLEMVGQIKIGRWLPFRAQEVLSPHRGFVWRARVAGLMVGSDRYVARRGAMEWKLASLLPILRACGSDLSRSAAGRAGGEAIWLPTALLPRFGVTWTAAAEEFIEASFDLDHLPISVRYQLHSNGGIRSVSFDRWGDPDHSGTWAWLPCGGEVTSEASFAGLIIPSSGSFGWHYGTDRWPGGEFFRYRIVGLHGD